MKRDPSQKVASAVVVDSVEIVVAVAADVVSLAGNGC